MIKNICIAALTGAVVLGAASCKNGSSYKHANGIEYKIVKDAEGKNAQIGDIMELDIVWKVGKNDGKSKDSVLIDTRKMNNGKPIQMPLSEAKFKGDMQAGLAFLSAGDSAIIRVSVDSLKKNLKDQPMPPFAKDGDYFVYEVKVVSVKSKADAEKEAQQKAAQQNQADDKVLQDYFAKSNLKPMKTASGVYYTIEKEGTGATITKGQTVTMKYTGKLLDGKVFDSNIDPQFHHADQPFTIQAGTNSVIPGMEEGILALKKGCKATLYIPSALAYGERSPSQNIPPNAILIFELEVTEVK